MVTEQRLYTAKEFWNLIEQLDEDKRYELVEGVITEMPPSSPENTIIAGRILAFLFHFVEEHELGYVSGADGGYTLSPGNVRLPDVAFISKARVPAIPKEFSGAPDLAVEVISPSESPRKIYDKTELYLNHGAQQVWNVYPEDQVIEIWQASEDGSLNVRKLEAGDTLEGADVLPGFSLPVSKIFPRAS
ncbi:MAG: Uma2 family endonuclease [Anaerolineae bacterium]|nr:Uma2 family endonuclease [Anaerolineae bacterium]